jgi:hypothetical protein
MADFVFKSNGAYLGFIENGNLFSRDGVFLGWIEGIHAWDSTGRYRGQRWNQNKYIIVNTFALPPVPRPPKQTPTPPPLPDPPANIAAIVLPTGWKDAF